MGTAMITRVRTPAPRAEWDDLLSADVEAVAEQSAAWIEVMATSGYIDRSRFYQFDDGASFVLPLVSRGRGTLVPQIGFGSGWGIGGIVGSDLRRDHVQAVVDDLASLPAAYVHIRPNPLQASAWAGVLGTRAVPRRAHVVDLAGGSWETFARFRKSGRKGVAKAERAGVDVKLFTGGDMLDEYYEHLFLSSVGRWAARQREPLPLAHMRAKRRDPLRKLHAMAAILGERFRLYGAFIDGELVGGNVVLWGPNAHATRGALNYERARESRAAYALDWAAIKDACEAGHRWYQLGESGQNHSLSDYKERFGAVPLDYHEHRIERVPLLAVDQAARTAVKRLIGFRD